MKTTFTTILICLSFYGTIAQGELINTGREVINSVRFSVDDFGLEYDSSTTFNDFDLLEMNGTISKEGDWEVYFVQGKKRVVVWNISDKKKIEFLVHSNSNILIPRLLEFNNDDLEYNQAYGVLYRSNKSLYYLVLEGLIDIEEELIVGTDTLSTELMQYGSFVKDQDLVLVREVLSLDSDLAINGRYFFFNNYLSAYSSFNDSLETIYLLSKGSCVNNVSSVSIIDWRFDDLKRINENCFSSSSVMVDHSSEMVGNNAPIWLKSGFFAEFMDIKTTPLPELKN